jgi:hypothetical protein
MVCVTVKEVFKAAGLSPNGPLPWGTPIPEQGSGVYLVELLDQGQRDDGQVILYVGRTKRSSRWPSLPQPTKNTTNAIPKISIETETEAIEIKARA